MAKRSKKKNHNALSQQQKADIRHNQTLDLAKGKLDKKLNITAAVVIAIAMISLLLLPMLNMNFSGSLSEFLGSSAAESEDQTMSIEVNMSTFDFLFAMTKGYSNSIEYIANSNASGIGATIIYNAFLMKTTQEDIDMLDNAYIIAFILSILLIVTSFAFVVITAVVRPKKKDGVLFLTSVIVFSVLAILQWIFFVTVGIASAGRGQIQPHIASYLLFAGAVTLCVVYGIYRQKVKKLNASRKPVEEIKNAKDIKEVK